MIRGAALMLSVIGSYASDTPKRSSASVRYERIERVGSWRESSGPLIISGIRIYCNVCGKDPIQARICGRMVEAYCGDHAKVEFEEKPSDRAAKK